jgi:hypothetical protein
MENFGLENKINQIPEEMYKISGYNFVNFSKYIKNKKEDEIIKKAASEMIKKDEDLSDILYIDKEGKLKLLSKKDKDLEQKENEAAKKLEDHTKKNASFVNSFNNKTESEKVDVLKSFFDGKNDDKLAPPLVFLINNLSKENKLTLVNIIVNSDNKKLDKIGFLKKLDDIGLSDEKEKIIENFIEQNEENKIKVFNNIELLKENKRYSLFKYFLDNSLDEKINFLDLTNLNFLKKEEILKFVEVALEKGDRVQIAIFRRFMFLLGLENKEYGELLHKKIDSIIESEESNKYLLKLIKYLGSNKKEYFTKKIFDRKLGNYLIEGPLYHESDLDTDTLKRKKFEKTGSETTLLGGKLKDKLIIRHINPEAFLTWQSLYEDYKTWKENGFDYVPIEPIQSYNLNKEKNIVNVYSGVLDLNFEEWYKISNKMFYKELSDKKEKIIDVLNTLKVEHGHLHDENFCLRFERDSDGTPILKEPKIYLIDFDASGSYK